MVYKTRIQVVLKEETEGSFAHFTQKNSGTIRQQVFGVSKSNHRASVVPTHVESKEVLVLEAVCTNKTP